MPVGLFSRRGAPVLQTIGSAQFRREVRTANELLSALTQVLAFNRGAVAGQPSGATIVLVGNITLPSPLIIDTPVTLEGNGVLTLINDARVQLGSSLRGASRITLRGFSVVATDATAGTPVTVDNTNGATFVRMEDLDVTPLTTADTGISFTVDVGWMVNCRVAGDVTVDGVQNEITGLAAQSLNIIAGANSNRVFGGRIADFVILGSNNCRLVGVDVQGAGLGHRPEQRHCWQHGKRQRRGLERGRR